MSETDRATFLQTIQAEPANETVRLVFADWLDEQGDADGELVRLLCEVQRPQETECPSCKRRLRVTAIRYVIGNRITARTIRDPPPFLP